MKKIEAYVRPERINEVNDALLALGHRSMIHYDIWYRGTENEIDPYQDTEGPSLYDFMPKVKIELIVKDEDVRTIVEGISDRACTGHIGDGKIFVSPVETAMRIQTRETGDTVI